MKLGKTLLGVGMAMFLTTSLQAQTNDQLLEVGDSGVYFDLGNVNYDNMYHWMTAGVVGGIPTNNEWAKEIITLETAIISRPEEIPNRNVEITNKANLDLMSISADEALSSATNTKQIQKALDDTFNAGGGIVILKPGYYYIDEPLYMPSDVVLRGEVEGEVTLFIASNDLIHNSSAIIFGREHGEPVKNSGIENILIEGVLGKPTHDWNKNAIKEIGSNNTAISMGNAVENCWVDTTSLINVYNTTISLGGNNCTIRNVYINGSFDRAGGNAYFIVSGHHNLITKCLITHIRHFTLQSTNSAYNVIYDNHLRQEFSFHVRDHGHNLVENNKIILPGPNDPIEISGKYSDLGYPEYYDFEQIDNKPVFDINGKPTNYYAMMGTWSIQHDISVNPNVLYNNNMMEYNHVGDNYYKAVENSIDGPNLVDGLISGYEGILVPSPWSEPGVVYSGPYFNKPKDPWINFPKDRKDFVAPSGGTFYPVVLEEVPQKLKVANIKLPDQIVIAPNESVQINIEGEHTEEFKFVFSVDNYDIIDVDHNGKLTGIKPGTSKLMLTTVGGDIMASAEVIVEYKPVDVNVINNFSENFLTLPLNHSTNVEYRTIEDFYFISPTATSWSITGKGNKQMMLHQKNGSIETDYLEYGLETVSIDYLKYNADRGGKIKLDVQLIDEDSNILAETTSGLVDGTERATLELTDLKIDRPVKIRISDSYADSESITLIKEVKWQSHAFENGVNAIDFEIPDKIEVEISETPFDIPIEFIPKEATMKNVVYKSSDNNILKPTIEGLVAQKDGVVIVEITSTQDKNLKKECTVIVGEGYQSQETKVLDAGLKETFTEAEKLVDNIYNGTLTWELEGGGDYLNNIKHGIYISNENEAKISAIYPEGNKSVDSIKITTVGQWWELLVFRPTFIFEDLEGNYIKSITPPQLYMDQNKAKTFTISDINLEAPFKMTIDNSQDSAKPLVDMFYIKNIEFLPITEQPLYNPEMLKDEVSLSLGKNYVMKTKDFYYLNETPIMWSSDNENIVIINEHGVAKSTGIGEATITATGLDKERNPVSVKTKIIVAE